ncbi:hypothetical protein QYF36_007813 [Acer negundo]|nr:hypothetical protein QYF36_007813 [Acer negundo]
MGGKQTGEGPAVVMGKKTTGNKTDNGVDQSGSPVGSSTGSVGEQLDLGWGALSRLNIPLHEGHKGLFTGGSFYQGQ